MPSGACGGQGTALFFIFKWVQGWNSGFQEGMAGAQHTESSQWHPPPSAISIILGRIIWHLLKFEDSCL